jgi:hypothetical protein
LKILILIHAITLCCLTGCNTADVEMWTTEDGHHRFIAKGAEVHATITDKDGVTRTVDTSKDSMLTELIQLLTLGRLE